MTNELVLDVWDGDKACTYAFGVEPSGSEVAEKYAELAALVAEQ